VIRDSSSPGTLSDRHDPGRLAARQVIPCHRAPWKNKYPPAETPTTAAQMRNMFAYPVAPASTPSTTGPSPDPVSSNRKKVEVATPTLVAGTWLIRIACIVGSRQPNPKPSNTPATAITTVLVPTPMSTMPRAKEPYTGSATTLSPNLSWIRPANNRAIREATA